MEEEDQNDSMQNEAAPRGDVDGEEASPVRDDEPLAWQQCAACFAATLGSFLMGTAIGWSGPGLSLLQPNNATTELLFNRTEEGMFRTMSLPEHLDVTPEQANLVAALMPLGALTGGPLGAYLSSRVGRRSAMLLASLCFGTAYVIMTAATVVTTLLMGRFVSGIASGVTSIAATLYIAETAAPAVRGTLGSMFQLMVTLGILYVNVVGLSGSWRWLSVACLFFSLLWTMALTMVPETPAQLLAERKFDRALKSLRTLRGRSDVEAELSEIAASVDAASAHSVSFVELFTEGRHFRPLLVSLVLMLGQQFSGVNAVIFFSVTIFEAAGTNMNSFVECIVVALVQVLGTVAATAVVDRAGRRVLLFASSSVMVVSLTGLGAYFWLVEHHSPSASSVTWLPLTCLSAFIFFFAVGFGPIPWLMMGELFGQEVKEKAGAVSAGFNWSMAFVVTLTYGPLVSAVGSSVTFWAFAACSAAVLAFCYFFVPETKGRTIEEIQAGFRGNSEDDGARLIEQEDASDSEVGEERSPTEVVVVHIEEAIGDELIDQPIRQDVAA